MTVIHIDGHPREEELAAYVGDGLALEEVERLEAHVFDCRVCASRLQRAASLQMVLHEAAAVLEAEAAAPPRRSRLRRRLGAVSALWASAAAVVLMVLQQGGGVALDPEAGAPARAMAAASESPLHEPSVTGCDPGDPRCAGGLLASVDPLQSVDPLSTWPDEGFTSAGWDDEAPLAGGGEPCGSGEDGGPLVCQPASG
jgi:hypothetical protein